ncbi:sensor histidine kinase [Cellulomonas sp. DKR-3]|uniref:histidine kinase n=1 Tax=Cellulomonas fulva TaxID=2835530 RepID=A0ABS5TWC2_9CELL|nr:histidine kinase [Cellulomonas fulva]MBT0993436.1 sensor histidine kinase [Cellulomonas fulva]
MIPDAARRLWALPPVPDPPVRVWRDWALVGLVVVGATLEVTLRKDVAWPVAAWVMALVLAGTLLWRRTHPLTTVVVAFSTVIVVDAVARATGTTKEIGLGSMAFVLLLGYALYRWGSGRQVVLGSAVLLTAFTLGIARDWTSVVETIAAFCFMAAPAVVGLVVRLSVTSRARTLDAVRLREREQLARELHDTVAHHVSAIVVRAQAGRVVAGADPAAAAEALAVIEQEGARTLAEMRTLVGALRGSDEAALAPTRDAADVPGLAAIDPRVVVERTGRLDDLGPAVGGAVYRIAQESVTNAVRHARSATRIVVRVVGDDDAVRCTVSDDGEAAGPARGGGYGIAGMTERASLLGGTLVAGPTDRGWLVTAELPRERLRP